MKKFLLTSALLFSGIIIANAATDDVNLPVPIDGGISILLASGIAYGVKKIADSHKSEK